MSRVTVLYSPDQIGRLYSITPLVASRHSKAFEFTTSLERVLDRGRGGNLLLVRFHNFFQDLDQMPGVLKRLRDGYRKIIYFDDRASADWIQSNAFEHCDLYYKKQISRDRSYYANPLPGAIRYRAYYRSEFGAEDPEIPFRPGVPPEQLHKLRLAWNLGIGFYPREKAVLRRARFLGRHVGPRAMRFVFRGPPRPKRGPRGAFVSARFARSFDAPSWACQRELYEQLIRNDPRFRTGRLPRDAYNRELGEARVTLSPFGLGEICFRDFEAAWSGSALVKPEMGHVETWPDVYRPGETCEWVRWDGSDLVDRCTALLDDEPRARRLAENALDVLRDAHARLDEKVEQLLEDFAL